MTLWRGWHDERVLASVADVPNWIGDAAANSSMRNRRASSCGAPSGPLQLPGPVCLQRGWRPHTLRPMLFIASPPRCRPGRLLAFEDGLLVTRFHASAEAPSSCDVGWRRQLMVGIAGLYRSMMQAMESLAVQYRAGAYLIKERRRMADQRERGQVASIIRLCRSCVHNKFLSNTESVRAALAVQRRQNRSSIDRWRGFGG